ncbi:Endonuclease V [hydrothermal vent metagenome]|uniref:Endonuclease V n=1 Tax=hydrothermal vent metagenome TaxID=652676 RepID=A0A3B0Z5Y6_9ZZZZ
MILAFDVHYGEDKAFVAGVGFHSWQDRVAEGEYHCIVNGIESYEPGSFYKREMPCILALLNEHQLSPEIIVVDGYVYLDGHSRAGLGKHLYDALNQEVPIIGVAKQAFKGISDDYAMTRGSSKKPLFVTSAGVSLESAKSDIETMAGENRIPLLLKKVDQLCRELGSD